MVWTRRSALALFVGVVAALCFFSYHRSINDHFDRLARARQIAAFGEVPFRDFFDPGYFLTLYSSVLVARIFGDNLLGEVLLNVSFMAAGTTLVFLMAARASRSLLWGLTAAALVVISQPRSYDFDKVLFYPLGLYACWHYIDRPTLRSLLIVSAVTVLAGLFRYDSAVYIGAGMFVAVAAQHHREWRLGVRRLLTAAVAMLVLASPALIFIEHTAGLRDAWDQITVYARHEGRRSKIFQPPTVSFGSTTSAEALGDEGGRAWTAAERWIKHAGSAENAAAWLYYVALAVPLWAGLVLWRRSPESPLSEAAVLTYSVLTALAALFILRDPISARLGGVMPLVAVGGGYLMGEWIAALRTNPRTGMRPSWLKRGLLATGGGIVCVISTASVHALIRFPPKAHLEFGRRWVEYGHVPIDIGLLPKGQLGPLVNYVHDCTRPTDRVLATWFVGELYFFSGRGFAAGLPVMFGDHWSDLRFQRRSIALLERQSVPIILFSDREEGLHRSNYEFLWNFIQSHYEPSREIMLSDETVQIWVRRGRPVERFWGPSGLPCFAPQT